MHSSKAHKSEPAAPGIQPVNEKHTGTPDQPANAAAMDCTSEFPKYTRYGVLASCFILTGLSCGSLHAWGVQQEYLTAHDFANDPGRIKTLSYIGTLMYFGIYIWGMLAGWLAEVWSYRMLCFIGVVCLAVGPLAASFCSEGIIFGLGCGLVYSPASTAPARWFTRRRGMATGLALSGVGVGGLIIAPLTEFLVRHIGVPWSQRISAIYTIVFGAIACYFVRVPFQDKSRTLRNFDWKAFHDRRFAIQALMVFFATAAYLVPVSYLPQFWTSHGVGAETASVMIAISNVSNAVGRLAMGVAADYIGVLNSLVLGVGCSTIGALVIWPFATSVGSGLVMGIIYGFGSGGYWTLVPLAAAKLFGIDKLASNTGIFYTLSALSAWIGNPVGGAILANSRHGSQYLGMIMYVGALWAVSFFFASCNRLSYSRQVLVKV